MSMDPGYLFRLQPGMKYDFEVHAVAAEPKSLVTDAVSVGRAEWSPELSNAIKAFCEARLQHPHLFLEATLGHAIVHVQLSHPADVRTLMQYCTCKEHTTTWTLGDAYKTDGL